MGFKEKLRAALIEEEPPKPGSRPAATTGFSQAVPVPVATVVATGVADEKFLGLLTNAIDQASEPAWMQFIGLLTSMASIIKDEATLYQAAFKAGQSQGLTYAALEAAATQRLKLLDAESKKFEVDLSAKAGNDVPAKEGQLRAIDQQLAALQAQMTQLQRQREALLHDMEQTKSRLDTIRQRFNTAQAALRVTLEQQLSKIRAHLQNA